MKLLILLSALIAAFTVNCGDLPDGTKAEVSTNEIEDIHGGSIEPDNPDEEQHFPNALMNPITLGKKQLIPEGGEHEDQDTSDINHQINEEKMGQRGIEHRASKCGADIVCSLLGGDCVSNEIYCTGREVKTVCNGTNCKCCIPVSLSVKMHVVEVKLQTIESKLDSLLAANSKLDSIINSNSNLTITNSNMDRKIDSIISSTSNLTQANSDMTNELQVIKENMTNANANQDVILDSIKEHQGCPKGMFLFAPSNQCFRLLNDTTRSWDNARKECRSKGQELAQPYDPLSLRDYMISRYGMQNWLWVDARGDGSNQRWQRTKKAITSSNPLWISRSYGTSHCLTLAISDGYWKSYPTKIYYSSVSCSSGYWALCELIRE